MTPKKTFVKRIKKPTEQAVQQAAGFKKHPIFKDKLFIGFVVINALLCVALLVLLVINVHPRNFVVPIQYSTLQGFDALGSWYQIYVFGLFSLLVTIGNVVLAAMVYSKSRIISFFFVFSTSIINILSLVVIITLISNVDL